MYYKLKDDVRLRAYDRLPRLVVQGDRPIGVSAAEFQALDLCDGAIDVDFPLVPEGVREAIPGLVEKGLVEACEKGTPLKPGQALRRYPNRLVKGVQWSITGACNYRCRHCFMEAPHAKHSDLSTEELLDICDQFAAAGVGDVGITGGEPLIRKDFLQIAQRIVDDGMRLTQIYTNGALVTEELLDALAAMGARPQFCISFDGVGCHDWLRGVDGAEAAAERAFRLCSERGFPTHASMVIHAGNVDTLLETTRTLASWGVPTLKISGVEPVGEWAKGGRGESVSRDELIQAYLDFVPRYVEMGMPMASVQIEALLLVERPDAKRRGPGFDEAFAEALTGDSDGAPAGEDSAADVEGTQGPVRVIARRRCQDSATTCLCLTTRLNPYISSEGRVLPCMTMADIEGAVTDGFPSLRATSLQSILTDSTLLDATDSRGKALLAANEECASCEYALDCLGGCRAAALKADPDNYLGVDRGACELFKKGWVDRAEALAKDVNERYARSVV